MQISKMSANPHFYDYIHLLNFQEERVDFVDGAGQRINAVARGKYRSNQNGIHSSKITFYDLEEINPYQKDAKIRDIAEFTVKVTREIGIFAFMSEIVWNIKDKAKHPCLLYSSRYIFDFDPLHFSRTSQMRNAYYLLESRELLESARYYYQNEDKQELSWRELQEMGISQEQLIQDKH